MTVALLVLIGVLVSCSSTPRHSIDESQAAARSKALTHEIAHAVAPNLTPITATTPNPQIGGCGPEYPNQVSVGYSLNYASMPTSQTDALLAASKRWLQSKHYEHLDVETSGTPPFFVAAETSDGFTVSYNVAIGGTSFFATGSPCVSKS